ncbi:MAG: T9SS type A sorting domain-containing protein [Bacteroidetes bacterium]|nr:T9SS type A sorting domain-containing protein [Bacteroidota bacterium]
MKKVFTLLWLSSLMLSGFAQFTGTKHIIDPDYVKPYLKSSSVSNNFIKNFKSAASRAKTVAFTMDYGEADIVYAAQKSTTERLITFNMNSRYKNEDNLSLRYLAVIYDSLIDADYNAQVNNFYPRKLTTLTLDSLDFVFIHSHTTSNNDTIHVIVFDRDSLSITGTGINAALNNNNIWDTLIVTNSEIPKNINVQGTPTYSLLTLYPNITFPKGKTFGVRIEFAGDTQNKFQPLSFFRDDCGGACIAAPSTAGFNSLYYLNFIHATQGNISGINNLSADCNQNGRLDPENCEEFYIQNWWVVPAVTAVVDYGSIISSDSLRGCPGQPINLEASVFGSDPPYTYNWSTSSGTLTGNSSENTTLILGNTAGQVTVSVDINGVDGANTSTYVVSNNAISILISNPNPIVRTCNESSNTVVTVTGMNQTGKTYLWNNGATTPTLSVNEQGNYIVTVTNSSGCNATASIGVNYVGNITNNVSFISPAKICQNQPVTFTNTSSGMGGSWIPAWDMYNNGSSLIFNSDAVFTYTNPGNYTVKLTMDTLNGCKFSASKLIQVLPSANPQCTNIGISDITFENAITMMPNPTNGNVNITVNGVEKNLSIHVYNIIGSEVKSFNSNDLPSVFTKSFDYSNLTNGTYLVRVQSGDRTAIKKLVINH